MDTHRDPIRQILVELLTEGPQPGARLRERLSRQFERTTGISFNAVSEKFPKFSALLAANSDLLEVVRPAGPGDVTVRLRDAAPQATWQAPSLLSHGLGRIPVDLWQAFTNPDPRRRRFFNIATRRVAHFIEGSLADLDQKIARDVTADKNYVEITPVPASRQSDWLREFLQSAPLPEGIRTLCGHLAGAPYSSSVNTAFTVALGSYAGAWKQFRASRILEWAKAWADRNSISLSSVAARSDEAAEALEASQSNVAEQSAGTPLAGRAHGQDFDTRKRLHVLIDSLDEEGIRQILLPAALLFKLNVPDRRA